MCLHCSVAQAHAGEDQTLTATFCQPFDISEVITPLGKEKRSPESIYGDLYREWLLAVDTLRNLLLLPTAEKAGVFQTVSDFLL
jgi:hypothetical protein